MASPQPTDNLPALVAEARTDPAAFAAVYERFVKPVYHYIYRRTGNRADAEDLTAQTFLTALESLPRYREQGSFAAWLFAIARSKTVDHFRAGQAQLPLTSAEQTTGEGDLLSRVVTNDALAELSDLICALDDDEQELIRLRYAAGLSFAEMAALLGKNAEAVKKSLYRLLARLQSRIEVHHE